MMRAMLAREDETNGRDSTFAKPLERRPETAARTSGRKSRHALVVLAGERQGRMRWTHDGRPLDDEPANPPTPARPKVRRRGGAAGD